MPEPLLPKFDSDRLHRQQRFLLSRAESHSRAESANIQGHRAAAASFIRDAAAIALIKGEAEDAANLFMRAGEIFAEIGVLYGFQLMVLGDPQGLENFLLERSEYAQDLILFLHHDGLARHFRYR